MNIQEFSFQELYDVIIRLKAPTDGFPTGFPVAVFDRVTIASIDFDDRVVMSRGGASDKAIMLWQDVRSAQLLFTEGAFAPEHFASMINSKIYREEDTLLPLSMSEKTIVDLNGYVSLKEEPVESPFFFVEGRYREIVEPKKANSQVYFLGEEYAGKDIQAVYRCNLKGKIEEYSFGTPYLKGFLSLEGKTKVESRDGKTRVGVLTFPKIQLVSNLSMRLGEKANPLVMSFGATAYADGPRGKETIMGFTILEE